MPDHKHQAAAVADDSSLDEDEDGGVRRPLVALVAVVAAWASLIATLTLIERHLGPPQEVTAATIARSQSSPEQFPWQPP